MKIGSRRQGTGGRRQEAGGRGQEAGDSSKGAVSSLQSSVGKGQRLHLTLSLSYSLTRAASLVSSPPAKISTCSQEATLTVLN